MKKYMAVILLGAVAFTAGCASTDTTAASTANQPLTLEQALQKSAETRQKLQDAKSSYESAKTAAQASKTNNTSLTTELAKQAVQNKVNNAKQQLKDEKQAWKEILK